MKILKWVIAPTLLLYVMANVMIWFAMIERSINLSVFQPIILIVTGFCFVMFSILLIKSWKEL